MDQVIQDEVIRHEIDLSDSLNEKSDEIKSGSELFILDQSGSVSGLVSSIHVVGD